MTPHDGEYGADVSGDGVEVYLRHSSEKFTVAEARELRTAIRYAIDDAEENARSLAEVRAVIARREL